jgi:hypothetical protein
MTCPNCSAAVEGQFCSKCGARVAPPQTPPVGYQYQAAPQQAAPPVGGYAAPQQPYAYAPVPYVPRVQTHVRTLGILWCVYGGYRVLAGITASIFLLGMSHSRFFERFNPDRSFPFASLTPMMGGIAAIVLVMTIGAAALAFVTGFALLNRKSWGRTVAMVAAILSLIKIPFGTALGIYTLWVLMPGNSAAEYEAMAERE